MVWWWVLNHAILLGSLIKFGFVLSTIQSAIKATNAKGKKDKKKPKKSAIDPIEDEAAVEGEAPSKGPVEMTAEELADEEWGAVKEKGKKSKKSKGKKGKAQDDEDDETPGTPGKCTIFDNTLVS